MDEYSWASAVGRVRIKEKELLSRPQLQQAAEAADLTSALAALRDTSYGPYVAGVSDGDDYVVALERALNRAYDYAMSIAPAQILLSAFRGRHDFHNLKVLAKAAHGGGDSYEQAFSNTGNFTAEGLKSFLLDESSSLRDGARADLTAEMKALRRTHGEALSLVAKSADRPPGEVALQVDSIIDRSYYGWASSLYRKYGHPGLKEFLSAEVDQLNVRVAVRAARLRIPLSFYASMALPGGAVPAPDLVRAYPAGVAAVARLYRGTPWESLAGKGAALCEKGEPLTGWERSCDDALMAIVRKARSYSLGPEPVFGFVFAKEAEARNLRVVLSGKQSGVKTLDISERLRDPYV